MSGSAGDPDRARPVRAMVVDDEALARQRIRDLLRDHEDIRMVAECATGAEALEAIRRWTPHLLFLDIRMPGLDGLQLLRAVEPRRRPRVIFSTAYERYAVEAFDVNAVDYLLKPFADERFHLAVSRALDEIAGSAGSREAPPDAPDPGPAPTTAYPDRLAVRERDHHAIVETAGIDRIEAAGDYVELHSGNRRYLLRTTMASMESRLDTGAFVRIHRSAIVRLDRIRRLHPAGHGDQEVELTDGTRLRVGRRYRRGLERRLGMDEGA